MKRIIPLLAILLSTSSAHAEDPTVIALSEMKGINPYLEDVIQRYNKNYGNAIPADYAIKLNNCRIAIQLDTLKGQIVCPVVHKVRVTFLLDSEPIQAISSIGARTFIIQPIFKTATGGKFYFAIDDKLTTMTIRTVVKKYQ